MEQKLTHKRPAPLKQFYFGAPYYPEHWDAATREGDPALMAQAGFNMVRMAEFAWDLMEPREGMFDFTLFDETIDKLGQRGIVTLLCTPTATPPRWFTALHAEALRVDADGRRMQHGSRQHCCHSSPVFREYSRRVTKAMAEHFRDNEYVVAWQTDNELNCHFSECHCENCQAAFRDFLRGKYGNEISALNEAWGTSFWAQTYRNFDEITTPREARPAHTNPSHQLDYYRFLSWAVARFQHDQVEILRAVKPAWWITHNGWFSHIDYRGSFTRDLDVLGFDSYPFFNYAPETRRFSHAYALDLTRAWSGNFVIPEQQSGAGGQKSYFHDSPEPGEMRRMTYSSIARGADSLLYFRWRTCRFGAEEYWLGLIDHDNVPRRRYNESCQVGSELKTVGPEVLGTWVHIEAAVAAADKDAFEAESSLHFGLPSPDDRGGVVHRALYRSGFAVGCVHPSDDLSDLKLLFVPHWALFNPEWLDNLSAWVHQGGVLVVGARTATRDTNNHVVAATIPGCLRELAGVTVEEYGKQNATTSRPLTINIAGASVRSEHWYEKLLPDTGAETVAQWESRHLAGSAAITRKKHGNGWVYYAGTYFTEQLTEALLPLLAVEAKLKPLLTGTPEGVEITQRRSANKRLWFIVNHNDHPVVVPTLPSGTDLITGRQSDGPLQLEPNDVAVIRSQEIDDRAASRAATAGGRGPVTVC